MSEFMNFTTHVAYETIYFYRHILTVEVFVVFVVANSGDFNVDVDLGVGDFIYALLILGHWWTRNVSLIHSII
jgi:branched-subunit amino acid transport protein AzlD